MTRHDHASRRGLTRLVITSVFAHACATTDLVRTALPADTGPSSVHIEVYRTPSAAGRHSLFDGAVVTRLTRLDKGDPILVYDGSGGHHEMNRLDPGRYRFELVSWTSARGSIHKPRATESFLVSPGEAVTVQVILKDHRGLLWTLFGVTAGGVGIAIVVSHTK